MLSLTNDETHAVQTTFTVQDDRGKVSFVQCFLTGDGKGMQAQQSGAGEHRFWVYEARTDDLSCLSPIGEVSTHVRCGSFLLAIPRERRVGDFAHCATRVVNAFLKRLQDAVVDGPSVLGRSLRAIAEEAAWEGHCLPVE